MRHHRLEKARELLENTNMKVKDIACEVGMTDVTHFSREFKKAYGRPPNEHRQYDYDEKSKQRIKNNE